MEAAKPGPKRSPRSRAPVRREPKPRAKEKEREKKETNPPRREPCATCFHLAGNCCVDVCFKPGPFEPEAFPCEPCTCRCGSFFALHRLRLRRLCSLGGNCAAACPTGASFGQCRSSLCFALGLADAHAAGHAEHSAFLCGGFKAEAAPVLPAHSSLPTPGALPVPGEKASTVTGNSVWDRFFSVLGRSRSPLSIFWHSLRTLPRTESRGPP